MLGCRRSNGPLKEQDEITFSLTRNIGGTDMKVAWKGKIAGDEIKFTRSVQGGGPGGGGAGTEITAKRAKE